MEHIKRATNTDQDVENLKILCDYLGKAHYMMFKFCCKLNLNFANPTTPWKSSLREKCIWHSHVIVTHMNSINTCLHFSLIMHQAEAHDYLYKLLGKKLNKVIQNYLVTINYWAKWMTADEREKYFD